MTPRLAAIVVNFNRRALLLGTLDSLERQTTAIDEIVVVDNASTDDSVAAVRKRQDPRIRVLALTENGGSSGGFARGIAAALQGPATHFLVLDSDVELAPNCTALLLAHLRTNPKITVAGPKVALWETPNVLQEFGGWIDWSIADLRRSHFRHDETRDGPVPESQEVDYVPACGLLATRDAFVSAGNFSSEWFLYWDDIDWCERVRRKGQRIAVVAAARLRHFGGGANKRNLLPVYYGWRNRLTFFRRFTPAAERRATLTTLLEDYLLARFTCRALGLTRIAAIMELGITESLAGITGRRDFAGVDLQLDDVAAFTPDASARISAVHHVIGSATAEFAADPARVLRDRFGKQLPATRAWELRQQFVRELARDLPPLRDRALGS